MEYYNKNIEDDLKHIIKIKYYKEWLKIVKPILLNDEFQRRKLFIHHSGRLWDHLTQTSYYCYLIAKLEGVDEKVAAISGLLHDFYPKAYKYSKPLEDLDKEYLTDVKKRQPIHKMHAFTHGEAAAKNARKFFPDLIDDKIYSCIKTHMFPLTLKRPEYKEGWIVQYVDKYLSIGLIRRIKYKLERKLKK